MSLSFWSQAVGSYLKNKIKGAEVAEMRFLNRVSGFTLHDRVCSLTIQWSLRVQPLLLQTKWRQPILAGLPYKDALWSAPAVSGIVALNGDQLVWEHVGFPWDQSKLINASCPTSIANPTAPWYKGKPIL